LFTNEGEEYLDFAAGIAVNSLGHSHPHLVNALNNAEELAGAIGLAFIKRNRQQKSHRFSDHQLEVERTKTAERRSTSAH
jgi:acetylornithine/N-succinyldiaminopimelate aminotransferase